MHPVAVSEEFGGARWRELLEPGVRHALVCGVTMQVLQQFSGINGVLYYTPQILDQAGVSVLLASLGLSADSTSILISGLTTLLMLPTIGVAMRLMDASGRRSLLLWTIPVLIASLAALVAASVVPMVFGRPAGALDGAAHDQSHARAGEIHHCSAGGGCGCAWEKQGRESEKTVLLPASGALYPVVFG